MENIETGYWTPEDIEEFFFDEEAMTSEEVAAQNRSMEAEARAEMIGEMYAAQYAFD